MTGDVIKSFLVSLGFDVDEGSLKKFVKGVTDATIRVGIFAASVKAAAAGIFYSISKVSDGFEQMGYEYRIIAPMLNKVLVMRNELLKAYRAAGINIQSAVINSVKFNMALAKTKFQLEGIYKSVGLKFLPILTKQMDFFRSKVSANMTKILAYLEKFVKLVFKASEAVTLLAIRAWSILSRVWDMFLKLDEATNGWSTKILLAVAAWKYLNLQFLATPLGMILSGLLAILALYDDFMVWKEGGQSFFDWGSETTRVMVGLSAAILGVAGAVYGIVLAMKAYRAIMLGVNIVQGIFNGLILLNPVGLMIAGVTVLIGLLVLLIAKWTTVKDALGGFFSSVGGKILNFIGGDSANPQLPQVNNLQASPPGAGGSTAQTVNQETKIVVNGNSDPRATAREVVGMQKRTNFDMARNLKGAAR